MKEMVALVAHAPYGLQQSYPGSLDKRVNVVRTRRTSLIDNTNALVQVPVISANALRARLRRAVAAEVERQILAHHPGARIGWQAAALLYAGGASMKDVAPSRETLAALATVLPTTLFGGNWFSTQLPGRLMVTDLLPATETTPPSLFGLSDTLSSTDPVPLAQLSAGATLDALVQLIHLTKRLDDSLTLDDDRQPFSDRYTMDPATKDNLSVETGPRHQERTEDDSESVRHQNLISYETAVGGLWWFAGFSVLPAPTPVMTRHLQSLLRWALERVFLDDPALVLGGHHNSGVGLLQSVDLQVPATWPGADLWITDWLVPALDDLVVGLSPTSFWLKNLKDTKARANRARQAARGRGRGNPPPAEPEASA